MELLSSELVFFLIFLSKHRTVMDDSAMIIIVPTTNTNGTEIITASRLGDSETDAGGMNAA